MLLEHAVLKVCHLACSFNSGSPDDESLQVVVTETRTVFSLPNGLMADSGEKEENEKQGALGKLPESLRVHFHHDSFYPCFQIISVIKGGW